MSTYTILYRTIILLDLLAEFLSVYSITKCYKEYYDYGKRQEAKSKQSTSYSSIARQNVDSDFW